MLASSSCSLMSSLLTVYGEVEVFMSSLFVLVGVGWFRLALLTDLLHCLEDES